MGVGGGGATTRPPAGADVVLVPALWVHVVVPCRDFLNHCGGARMLFGSDKIRTPNGL